MLKSHNDHGDDEKIQKNTFQQSSILKYFVNKKHSNSSFCEND